LFLTGSAENRELRNNKGLQSMVHMFKESHLELLCPGCKKEHNGSNGGNNSNSNHNGSNGNNCWKPEFWNYEHYKTMICDCGYKIFFKTEHFHSGHY